MKEPTLEELLIARTEHLKQTVQELERYQKAMDQIKTILTELQKPKALSNTNM